MTRPSRGRKTRNPEYVRRNEPRVGEETMEKGQRESRHFAGGQVRGEGSSLCSLCRRRESVVKVKREVFWGNGEGSGEPLGTLGRGQQVWPRDKTEGHETMNFSQRPSERWCERVREPQRR